MKKRIAIDIDFLLRDWIKALDEVYKKQIDDSVEIYPHFVKLWEYYPFPVYTEVSGETDSDIVENILIVDESKEYEPNEKLFNKFVSDNVLEIFGHAKEATNNAVSVMNKFYFDNIDKFDITLFSKVNGKARPSTLFFLSKCGCELNNIKFIKDSSEITEYDKVIVHECKKILLFNKSDNVYFIKSIDDLKTLEL